MIRFTTAYLCDQDLRDVIAQHLNQMDGKYVYVAIHALDGPVISTEEAETIIQQREK